MSKTLERRLDERRGPVRRNTDIKRALLEESLRELPNFFVSYVDAKQGVFTFYYNDIDDAKDMVAELKRQGLEESGIALYSRSED